MRSCSRSRQEPSCLPAAARRTFVSPVKADDWPDDTTRFPAVIACGKRGRRAMDFSFSDEQKMLRDSVRKLMDRHAPPDYIRKLDKEQAYPYALYDEWVKAGLLRMPFPEE